MRTVTFSAFQKFELAHILCLPVILHPIHPPHLYSFFMQLQSGLWKTSSGSAFNSHLTDGADPIREHDSATLTSDLPLIPCKLLIILHLLSFLLLFHYPTCLFPGLDFIFLSWSHCTHRHTHLVSQSVSDFLTEWLVRMLIPACMMYCHLLPLFQHAARQSIRQADVFLEYP